jgi:hypothetical protein
MPAAATSHVAEFTRPVSLTAGLELEVKVIGTPRRLVASVEKVSGDQVTLRDFADSVWTHTLDAIRVRPATPKARRRYRWSIAQGRFDALTGTLTRSITDLSPLRRASSADESTEALEVVHTPIGSFIWPRRRTPSNAHRREWKRLARELAAAETEIMRYGVTVDQIEPNRFIPSNAEVEDLCDLEKDGLLDVEESLLVGEWASFWAANPTAVHGTMQADGTIRGLSYERPLAKR